MTFVNTLGPIGWIILLAVPPLLVLLYFLKLRRHPVEVPSTFLWQRVIVDLHVNSFWQRLRRNLLLLLQLVVVTLVAIACLRPGWHGDTLQGDRFIFLLDTSASMQATDTGQTRFELARQRLSEMIEQTESDDQAMIISFSHHASIVQGYTTNRAELSEKLDKLAATNHTTDLREALLAASGLANPGRVSEAGTIDVQVADPRPATLYILSDGGVEPVDDLSLGNLTAKFIPFGNEQAVDNVGITAFSIEQNPDRLDQVQAFGRIENFGAKEVDVEIELFLADESRDLDRLTIPAGKFRSIDFDLPRLTDHQLDQAWLRLQLNRQDDLSLDNSAYAVLNPPRRARVLVVSDGNDVLKFALTTKEARRIAAVEFWPVSELASDRYRTRSQTGHYDLVIYDDCVPQKMPRSNTWFIGRVPPGEGWSGKATKLPPVVIDTDQTHPLMQSVAPRNVLIVDAMLLSAPVGSQTLIDSDAGPLLSIGPREGFEDVVLGMPFFTAEDDGTTRGNTNWLRSPSFPVFVHNLLGYLGGGSRMLTTPNVQPGNSVTLRPSRPVQSLQVKGPQGRVEPAVRGEAGAFVYRSTSQLGVYDVLEGNPGHLTQRFAVNLFSSRESDIRPKIFSIGHEDVEAAKSAGHLRVEVWKWLLAAALVVLLLELYVYHRRVGV